MPLNKGKLGYFCRTCAMFFDNSAMVPAFDEIKITTERSNEFQLADELRQLNVKIEENDGLPQQLCINCVKQLTKIHQFRNICIRSQKKLGKYFKCVSLESPSSVEKIAFQEEQIKLDNVDNDSVIKEGSTEDTEDLQNDVDKKTNTLERKTETEYDRKDENFPVAEQSENSMETKPKTDDHMIVEVQRDTDTSESDAFMDENWKGDDSENKLVMENSEKPITKKKRVRIRKKRTELEEFEEDDSSKIRKCSNCKKYGHASRFLKDKYACYFNSNKNKVLDTGPKSEFCCFYCDKDFDRKEILEDHIIKYHPVKKPFVCSLCPSTYSKPSVRNSHIEACHAKSRDFSCDLCDGAYTTLVRLNKHKRAQHPDGRTHECNMCLQTFYNKFKLNCHMKSHERPFKCRYCDKTFIQANHRKFHEEIHTNIDTPYKCDECNKSYIHLENYKTHMIKHSKAKATYFCEECGEGFYYLYLLNKHKKQKHILPYVCEFCAKRYGSKQNLNFHQDCYHRQEDGNRKNERRKFLERNSNGTRQIYKYPKNDKLNCLKCPVCLKSFLTPTSLNNHFKVHDKSRKYICSICNNGYKTSSSLASHMNQHTKIKEYECQYCNKIFYNSTTRRVHVKSHIENKRKCSFCDKVLSLRQMKNHERSHTQEKVTKCLICGETFTAHHLLIAHSTKHTKEELENIHQEILLDNEDIIAATD